MRMFLVGASGATGRRLVAVRAAVFRYYRPGLFSIVDDEPGPRREWLPALAEALGAQSPLHWTPRYPTWRDGFATAYAAAETTLVSPRSGALKDRARA